MQLKRVISGIFADQEDMLFNGYCKSPFSGAKTVTIGTQLTHNAKYNDIMIYKNND